MPVLPGPSIMLILSSAIHSLPHQLRYLLTLSFRNLMGFLLYVISIYNNAFFWIFIIIFLFLPQRFLKIISCMLTRVILVICYYIIECTCCVLTFAFLRIHTGGHLCRTWKLQIRCSNYFSPSNQNTLCNHEAYLGPAENSAFLPQYCWHLGLVICLVAREDDKGTSLGKACHIVRQKVLLNL